MSTGSGQPWHDENMRDISDASEPENEEVVDLAGSSDQSGQEDHYHQSDQLDQSDSGQSDSGQPESSQPESSQPEDESEEDHSGGDGYLVRASSNGELSAAEALQALENYPGLPDAQPGYESYESESDSDDAEVEDPNDGRSAEYESPEGNTMSEDAEGAEGDKPDCIEFPESRAASNEPHQAPPSPFPELTRLREQVRELEAAQWSLERKLHQAELQHDAARQAQERQAVLAQNEAETLRQLRTASAREKSQLQAQIVELNAAATTSKTDQQSRDRSFSLLRERFSTQSATLAELRQQLADTERINLENSTQARAAKQSAARGERQLELLREELHNALEDAAEARAQLDVQVQSIAEMRTQARSEALASLEEELPADESDGLWRKQYVALRREMDDIAAEFEQREPQIVALQKAYEEAEVKLTAYNGEKENFEAEKVELEKKLRQTERRAMDLSVFQQMSESQLDDLRRQVLVLLTEKALNATGGQPLSPEDEDELVRLRHEVARSDAEVNDVGENANKLITDRLLLFKDVADLQFQNEALLRACRELATQLDPESRAQNGAIQLLETRKMDDLISATHALESLESKFSEVKNELIQSRQTAEIAKQNLDVSEESNMHLKERIANMEARLKEVSLRVQRANEPKDVNPSTSSDFDENMLKLKLKTAEDRVNDLRMESSQYHDESRILAQELSRAKLEAGRSEQKFADSQNTVSELRTLLANEQHQVALLQQERQLMTQREQQLILQLTNVQMELSTARRDIEATREELSKSRVDGGNLSIEEQLKNLHTLIAQSAGTVKSVPDPELEERANLAEQQAAEASRKLEESLSRSQELQAVVNELESDLALAKSQNDNLVDAQNRVKAEFQSQVDNLLIESTQINTQLAEMTHKLSEKDHEIEAKTNKTQAREQELIEQVNDLEDKLIEAHDKAETVASENSKLIHKLEEQSKHVTEVEQKLGEATSPSTDLEQLKSELIPQVRSELEAAFDSKEVDVSDIPSGDLAALKARIVDYLPANVLDRFEQDVLRTEQNRTRELIKQKLDETRSNAQKLGEENASKRAEMRTKLQTQKMQKLENRNHELESQIEELRNKVRRLKGGETVDLPQGKIDDQSQDQSQGQQQSSGFEMPFQQANQFLVPSDPQAESQLTNPASSQPFGFPFMPAAFEPSKRPSFFADNEAKKRKEEE